MLVNVYRYHAAEGEIPEQRNADLREIMGDDVNAFHAAHAMLTREGRAWIGGGAAPLFLLYRVVDHAPVSFNA